MREPVRVIANDGKSVHWSWGSRALFCLLLACAQGRASASEPEGRSTAETATATTAVTLSEVVRRAQRDPPAVLRALATLGRTQAEERTLRGSYLPRVTMEGRAGAAYDNRPVLPGSALRLKLPTGEELELSAGAEASRIDATSLSGQGSVGVDWAVLDLARDRSVESARTAVQAQSHAVRSSQRLAIQAALELYVRALAAAALVHDAELTLQRRSAQQKATSALVHAGLRPLVDSQRADIEHARAEHALHIRQIEEQAAHAALSAALGADPQEPLRPAPLEDAALAAPWDLPAASRLAFESRPELREQGFALVARELQERAAIAARWPVAGVVGSGSMTYQDVVRGQGLAGYLLSGSAGVYVRWAALDATVWRRAEQARAATNEARRERETTELAIRAEVADASYARERAETQLAQASQVLSLAETTRTSQAERYRGGLASLLELLDAEATEQAGRLTRIEAERDLRVAQIRLLAACGVIERLAR